MDVYTHKDILVVAQRIVNFAHDARCHIFALSGDLGAGKTTLTQALVKILGSHDAVSSPTYAYMNRYSAPGGDIYHFDLYRLSSAQAFAQAGFEEYLTVPDAKVILEWPEVIADSLPAGKVCRIFITYVSQDTRRIQWEVF